MLTSDNIYTQMQKKQYEEHSHEMNSGGDGGHIVHNSNSDYWNVLLNDIINNKNQWIGKVALDFGCGCGRNVINLLKIANWGMVIGVDISKNNLLYCEKNILKIFGNNVAVKFFISNGINIELVDSNSVDFLMHTIVMQHICVWEIRYVLLNEMYRILKSGGLMSFQMGYDPEPEKLDKERFREYYDNFYEAKGTNSVCDTIISKPEEIINDLEKIGFNNITYQIREGFYDGHQKWIYIRCFK